MSKLSPAEETALQWAVSGQEDALRDPVFLRDNPGIANDPAELRDDILYRLEDQAPDIEDDRFVRAAARAAKKMRAAWGLR